MPFNYDMLKLIALLVIVVLVAPIAIASGTAPVSAIPRIHLGNIQLGNGLFSDYENFRFNDEKFQIQRSPTSITGYINESATSPVGDTININYTISYYKHTFTAYFPTTEGYNSLSFPGSRAYGSNLLVVGNTPFKYLTINFAILWTGNISTNGFALNQFMELSGAGLYNISINSTSSHYNIYLPGFVKVNNELKEVHLWLSRAGTFIAVKMSIPINDGKFMLNVPSVLSASSGISQYLSATSNISGPFAGLYNAIMGNIVSVVLGGAVFLSLFLIIYFVYRKK